MLPILRILPVGGLLLAILILVLALSPPDGSRAPLASAIVPSRGALLDRERQAEVRQFLIHAALKRADELNRLRELPDSPTRSDNGQSTVASLPGDRSEADPEEPTSINEAPVVSIPVEIREPSSAELPIAALEESAAKKPEPAAKLQRETRRRIHRIRRVRAPANPTPPRPFNFLEALFGGPQRQQPTYGGQQTVQRYQPVPDVAAQANPNAFSTVPRTNPY
ncbi:MAG: hypothetical protein WCF39_02370 [Pseudolabrys sp.]